MIGTITYYKAIYQLKRILEHSLPTDESRHNDEFLLDKIFQYRAIAIENKFNKTFVFDEAWLSNTGILTSELVDSSDCPSVITSGNLSFSKIYLPEVISLKNNYGYYSIVNISKQEKIYLLKTLSELINMIRVHDNRLDNFKFFVPINEYAYIYPNCNKVQAQLVLSNPLQGKTIQTMSVVSGDIIYNESYIVKTAQISYNGIVYSPGDVFTGVNGVSIFTGNGKVYYDNNHRSVNLNDKLPISAGMFPEILLNILTKEYQIEARVIPDLINDSKAG